MRTYIAASAAMLIWLPGCFADLVPISPIPTNRVDLSGSGYGNVLTLLNAQNTGGRHSDGLEANCNVIVAGTVQSSCSGVFAGLTLNDPGQQNQAHSLAAVGITDLDDAASQIRLIFNSSQDGSDDSITLDAIGMALWFSNNPIFSTLTVLSGNTYTQTDQGNGQSGFAYKLDGAGVTAAQSAINNAVNLGGATLNSILVTGAFRAGCTTGQTGCANDGPETLFLGLGAPEHHEDGGDNGGPSPVPEPASLASLGTALAAAAGIGWRRRRS